MKRAAKSTSPSAKPAGQARTFNAGQAKALELDTDAATVKRLMSLVGGTVGGVAMLGVVGVMYTSGAFSSMLGGKVEHLTPEQKWARTLEQQCKMGMVVGAAMTDMRGGKADHCDKLGERFLEAMETNRSVVRDLSNMKAGMRKPIGSGLIPN